MLNIITIHEIIDKINQQLGKPEMQFLNGKYLVIIQLIVTFGWTANYHSRRFGIVYGLEQNNDGKCKY